MPAAAPPLPRLAGILLVLGGAYVGLRLYPSELPAPAVGRRADLIATVLYDQAMVFLLRIVILCAAAFTVLSIVARIWNREWLTKAGPFEVERAAQIAGRDQDELRRELAEFRAMYTRFREAERGTGIGFTTSEADPLSSDHEGSDRCR